MTRSPTDWVLVPRDDDARDFSNTLLPDDMIYAGIAAIDRAQEDGRNHDRSSKIDWDDGMLCVAIYRAMLGAAPARLPDSPSVSQDEPDYKSLFLSVREALEPFAKMAPRYQYREMHVLGWRTSSGDTIFIGPEDFQRAAAIIASTALSVGGGGGSSNASRAAMGPLPHVAPEAEPSGLCEGCPPVGYPTDKTRCRPCPRAMANAPSPGVKSDSAEGH